MAPRSTGKGAKKKSESHSDSNNSNTDQQANPADAAPVVNEDDQPSVSAGHSSDLLLNGSEEFNDSLQKHIVKALCTPQVIEVITKAVTEAIMETVTQKVYESVDLDLQAKLAKMKKLEEDICALQKQITKATSDIQDLDLYSRRNCLRINGLPESPSENTDDLVLQLTREKLGVQLSPSDIDRSHRLPKSTSSEGPKPLIVKFSRYNARDQVYRARIKLRGTNIFINENLTKNRQILFNKVRESSKVKKAWTNDGRITAITVDNKKVKIANEHDIEKL